MPGSPPEVAVALLSFLPTPTQSFSSGEFEELKADCDPKLSWILSKSEDVAAAGPMSGEMLHLLA